MIPIELSVAAGVYLAASLVTLIAFGLDKRAAVRGRSRVPEKWLHLLELLGGWPVVLLGQRIFRHKTIKLSFRIVLWAIVVLHVAAWAAFGFLVLRS